MSIYYTKQDNTIWCCEEDSGPYQPQIEVTFVKCECESVWAGKEADMANHLQEHCGGGEVLEWRMAKDTELAAWYSGGDDAFQDGIAFENSRIIKLLEERAKKAGASLDFDGQDFYGLKTAIELIKGEQK